MFERTFSFWRRLIGQPESGSAVAVAGPAVQEDRRLWVRYETDVAANVQLAQQEGAERVAARLRDISLGGAKVVVDRPFEAGQILSLELPSVVDGELQIVLACVVRAVPHGNQRWSLGCVFSRELTADDLEKVGAQKAKAADDDQRSWVRYDCTTTATYQRIGDETGQVSHAQVLNVSASGVGLLLSERIDPGALISLSLQGKEGHPVRSILACIVHSTLRTNGELAVGCNFIRELTEDELLSLI